MAEKFEHKKRDSWLPAKLERGDVMAIKALAAGNANEGQQKRAIECILIDMCGIRDETFNPGLTRDGRKVDGERVSTFLQGRRSVGLQIARCIQMIVEPDTRGAPPPMPGEQP